MQHGINIWYQMRNSVQYFMIKEGKIVHFTNQPDLVTLELRVKAKSKLSQIKKEEKLLVKQTRNSSKILQNWAN